MDLKEIRYPVLGIDEVGRGCGAGPLFVGGVLITDSTQENPEWKDSKLLKPAARESFNTEIRSRCLSHTVSVTSEEIDRLGILNAVLLAMGSVIQFFQSQMNELGTVIVDGSYLPYLPHMKEMKPTRGVIERGFGFPEIRALEKADSICKAVSAASIIAKVERDALMVQYSQEYPGYGFEDHKGYFTQKHIEAIHQLGITRIHRRSFRIPERKSRDANFASSGTSIHP